MKSISAEAMAAIEAGEAIVTGALEIYSPGSEPIEIPAGTDIVLSWQQNSEPPSFPTFYNQGRMGFSFLDAGGDPVGDSFYADWYAPPTGVWTPRSVAGTSPATATTLRIHMDANHSNLASDQCFDSISLAVGGEAATLVNPGAETGDMTGWDFDVGAAGIPFYSVTSKVGVTPYSGSYFFASDKGPTLAFSWQDVSLSSFVPTDPVPPVAILRVWGGYGPIELDGETYQGIGDRGLVQQTAGAIGGVAQGLTLTLSGIEPELLVLLDADEIKGGAAVMRRLIFASDGKTLLDYDVWDRGRVDTVETEEVIGGGAAIKLGVESAARGLGRSGARQRSDSDQRLIDANDGYFRVVAYAAEKMLYWGGRKPSRVGSTSTLGGGSSFPSGAFAG